MSKKDYYVGTVNNPRQTQVQPAYSLSSECARFTAEADLRQLDLLWDSYASDPNEAKVTFDKHIGDYNRGPLPLPKDELPGRLQAAAAFGAIILASEMGDADALRHYHTIEPAINRIGGLVLNQTAQPIVDEHVGTALGVYLAASAADTHGHTVWKQPVSSKISDAVGALRKSKPAPGQPGKDVWSHDSGHVDVTAASYLRQRYSLTTNERIPALTLAYAEVVRRLGALPGYNLDAQNGIARQRIEDFVGACLRLTGERKATKPDVIQDVHTALRIAFIHDKEIADMFRAGAHLLRDRGIPVKGHTGGRVAPITAPIRGARNAFRKTTVGQRRQRPLPADWERFVPPKIDPPSSITQGAMARAKQTFNSMGASQSTSRNGASHNTRQAASPSLVPAKQRPFGKLASGETAIEVATAAQLKPDQVQSYSWAALFAALSLRRGPHTPNRRVSERKYLTDNENAMALRAARQVMAGSHLETVATTAHVPPEKLIELIELHRWAALVLASKKTTTAAIEKIRALSNVIAQSLDSHVRTRYGSSPNVSIPPAQRDALLYQEILEGAEKWAHNGIGEHPGVVILRGRLADARRRASWESTPSAARKK